MPFQSWDPIVEAVFFGCAFLLPLVAVLWVWYDSSGRIGSGRWFWRFFLTALVLFTTPAVALGAAHLDHSMDDVMSAFGWTAIASGCVAILGVVAYAIWGRSPMEEYRDEAPVDRAPGHAPPVKTAKAAQTVQPTAATTPPAAQPAMPAAPAPAKTTLTWSIFLPTTSSALTSAAPEMMAVPCWSSWNTGMSMIFLSDSSM
jgi:hypothetical protein